MLALAAVAVVAEPPSPYSYNRPSSGGGGFAGGFSSGGGFPGGFSSGGGLQQISGGPQTTEGLNVDPQLLEQVRQILLREETQSRSVLSGGNGGGFSGGNGGGFSGGFGGGAPSGSYGPPPQSYGPPSQSYGPPQVQSRITNIELENTIPAIQVAAFSQQSQASVPSGSYGAPSSPSGSYGAPF